MSQDSGSSIVTFVMGIAVGAVAVALYTPVTGPALRRRLSRAVDEGAEMAQGALSEADAFVQDQSKAARKIVTRAGSAFQKVRDEVSSASE
jgi:gas vesicle protein